VPPTMAGRGLSCSNSGRGVSCLEFKSRCRLYRELGRLNVGAAVARARLGEPHSIHVACQDKGRTADFMDLVGRVGPQSHHHGTGRTITVEPEVIALDESGVGACDPERAARRVSQWIESMRHLRGIPLKSSSRRVVILASETC
jgi:hypothetical protein